MDVEWSDDLLIGVELIDSQHKELFRRMAALRAGMREGEGRKALMETLDFFTEYVGVHFAAEESTMRRYNYPALFTHRQEHEKFTQEIIALKQELKSLESRNEIMSFEGIKIERRFSDWLKDHIGKTDKKLGIYLAERL